MEEEFVPYELALRLKELGFDKSTFGGWCHPFNNHKPYLQLNQEGEYDISAPTFYDAFRWFREKYELLSWVFTPFGVSNGYFHEIVNLSKVIIEGGFSSGQSCQYNTYEEAELACLEKLIEIVESKSE
jgi:hypothetical protein